MVVFKIILLLFKFLTDCKAEASTHEADAVASPGKYPFAVALLDTEKYVHCTGSLIFSWLVLTAAHCVGHFVFALAGDTVLFRKSNSQQIRNVTHSIKHPSHPENPYTCDLALAFVDQPFVLTTFVKVIHLCEKNVNPGDTCLNAGWSTFEDDFSFALQCHKVKILMKIQCPLRFIYKDLICASAFSSEPGQGCSGGPLIHKGKLCGIISARMLTSKGGFLFANVVRSKEWILSNGTKGGTQSTHREKDFEPKVILSSPVIVILNYVLFNL